MSQSSSLFARLRRVPQFLDHPAVTVLVLVIAALLLGVFPLVCAYGTKIAVDALTLGHPPSFARGTLILTAVAILGNLHGFLSSKHRLDSVQVFSAHLREAILDSALRMPLESYEKISRGDLVSRGTADVEQASLAITFLFRLAKIVIQSASATIYMLMLDWRVGGSVAAAAIAIPLLTAFLSKSGGDKSASFQKAMGDASTTALNALEGVQVIKAYCAEDQAAGWFERVAEKVFFAGMRFGTWVAQVQAWSNGAVFLPYAVAFGYGGYLAYSGQISLGTILALVSLYGTLAGPVADMSNQWAQMARSLAAFARVLEIVDSPADKDPEPRVYCGPRGTECDHPPDAYISVNALSFRYGDGPPVLADITFQVSKGQLAVIVGKSGCGKSTLLKLVSGLYRPDPGAVFVGGFDVHYSALSEVRPRIAYIPQDPYLFEGTIRENLLLGKEGARDEELYRALGLADAFDFVSEIADRMESQVSERGGSLSGGQRQKLCAARAVLRDAETLLMDEPTSSVDRESEARFWKAIDAIREGKTCLLVTHRLEVAKRADVILVMDNGRIVESGTHNDLLDRKSLYWKLYAGEGGVVA